MYVTSLDAGGGAVFWPGAGLTLAALALRPRGHWPALLLGVAAGEIVADLSADSSSRLSLSWALANTVEPAVGAYLLARWRGNRPDLTDVTTTLRFVVAAVVVGPAIGALVGTVGAWPQRRPLVAPPGPLFLGDAIGVLVIAPALLTIRSGRRVAVGDPAR